MSDERFSICGESGNFLQITISEVYGFPESVSFWGGYELRVILEIKSSGFQATSLLWTTTHELFLLYQELLQCNNLLTGSAKYSSYEHNLEFEANYDNMGRVIISGRFAEQMGPNNVLDFEFQTDQSFIQATIFQLQKIASKYGGIKDVIQ